MHTTPLNEARKHVGLTVAQVALAVEVDQRTVARWMAGTSAPRNAATKRRLAEVLRMTDAQVVVRNRVNQDGAELSSAGGDGTETTEQRCA